MSARIKELILRREPWTVETDPPERYQKEEDKCDGRMDTATCEIHIREDATPHAFLNILGHEWAHYVLAWSGFSNSIDVEMQEDLCDAFGKAVVELIEENIDLCNEIWNVYGGVYGDDKEGDSD